MQGTLPLLRHLLNVARSMVKGSGTYHKPDKAALAEWNASHEIVKLLLVSLGKCHSQAVASAKALCQSLSQETVVDGKYGYRHGQLIQAHLDLLQLLLKEADLYLPWARCKEMWDTLVTNPDACESDREVHISAKTKMYFSVTCFFLSFSVAFSGLPLVWVICNLIPKVIYSEKKF